MRAMVSGLVTLVVLSIGGSSAFAQRCDPTGADTAGIAAARAAADGACDCNKADQTHGQYVSCAVQQINASGLRRECRGVVKRCYSRSTCGKAGFVTCCRTKTNPRGTATKCSIKSDGSLCTASPNGGSACVGMHASCCDACTDGGCAP